MAERDEQDAGLEQPEAAADEVPEPAPLGPDDAVPRFRADLAISRGQSPSLFEVSDPATGRRFTLYEFELAVARMLDGRRTVREVVESGARLGIPMDADALHKFVRQMWHYGFLAPPGAADELAGHGVEEGGTWEAREPWDDATRTLFQTGQRLMRLGRNSDAASYFEAVLDAHPANPEATEMLALIARGQSLAAGPLGARDSAAAAAAVPGAPAAATPGRSRRALLVGIAVGVLLAGVAGTFAVLRRPPSAAATPAATATAAAPAPAAAPATAQPPPPWRSAPVERRSHAPIAEVLAPGDGTFTWTKASGARVKEGERLGTFRAAATRRKRRPRPVALIAAAAGELSRAPERTGRATAGETLARILDPAAWRLVVLVGPPEPAGDAGCEVAGDGPADRAACRIAGRSRSGERVEILAEVAAADAPWLARAAALHVRLAGAPAPAQAAVPPAAPGRGDAGARPEGSARAVNPATPKGQPGAGCGSSRTLPPRDPVR